MSIETFAAAVVAAQSRVTEFESKLADAQQLLADLSAKRTDAAERAQAALQAVRTGELTEAVAGLRHSLALQDATDLEALIAQGNSALSALINEVSAARGDAQRAQSLLLAEERRLIAAGLKARIEKAEEALLLVVTEAYRVHAEAGGAGSVNSIWWPSHELTAMVVQGIVPRR
ncbi:hypothetical protein WI91_08045 [Burkholderia vietnamiensis]|uniref:hypothetical protein n=1 Tax=Burkholderia vietnamiensis TaxID=60552 RepID=UPI00075F0AA9|nr:hypothetical protein [Burkholderia vietnamiensis]KVE06289.1 hypothetical protein WI91_08045 [Burkholderia vietnamiensis]